MDDVLIVGAGPAGSTLARLLAAQGVRVRLLDAAHFPRQKPCGESLNPGAVAALRRLGGCPEEGAPVRGWSVNGPGCGFVGLYPAGQRGLCYERRKLDELLLAQAEAAGAAVWQGARVSGLLVEGGRVAGLYGLAHGGRRFRLLGRCVVGADGIRSIVARCLGVLGQGPLRKLAITAHVHGVDGLADLGELHLGPERVAGLAPLGAGNANLTVVIPAKDAATIGGDKPGFLWRTLAQFPSLRARFAQAEIDERPLACGPFDLRLRRVMAPGALLVGDAAGYYDPLTGQGIYRALRSAEMAAAAIMAALALGRWSAFSQYEQQRRREFAAATWLQHAIEFALSNPRLLRGAFRALHWQPLSTWLMGRVGDCPRGG